MRDLFEALFKDFYELGVTMTKLEKLFVVGESFSYKKLEPFVRKWIQNGSKIGALGRRKINFISNLDFLKL